MHVLIFLDLGERPGLPFPPRLFAETTQAEWEELEQRLLHGQQQLFLASRGGSHPLSLSDVRFVCKERDDPYTYRRHRAFIVDELCQTLCPLYEQVY